MGKEVVCYAYPKRKLDLGYVNSFCQNTKKKIKYKKELYCSMALYSFFLGRSFKVAIHVVGEWHGLHDSCKTISELQKKNYRFSSFFSNSDQLYIAMTRGSRALKIKVEVYS